MAHWTAPVGAGLFIDPTFAPVGASADKPADKHWIEIFVVSQALIYRQSCSCPEVIGYL
jgi:hypothetical protein